ncbi:hypothetical protein [Halorussus litoreus]|uniref:hypothetical protein n=1 Tax=Halorussus litoreus TaxID=1710536 RepID=UPI0013009A17|nr:hypothetical protein [Halorussus litoreus]
MGARPRERDDMDLLKDITRELRGDDGPSRSDSQSSRSDGGSASDGGRSGGATAVRADSTGETTEPNGASDDASDTDSAGDDTHVCSFCETEFDADRRACPDCDAEIVLRGAR